jgi:hypothetical protein
LINGRDPAEVRIAIVCDNFSPHLPTKVDTRVGDRAAADTVEIAHTPTNTAYWAAERREGGRGLVPAERRASGRR